MQTPGQYIYAIADSTIQDGYGPIGIQGGEVQVVRHGSIAAIVSDFDGVKLRPERRNLAAHNAVIKKVMEFETVLPMAFGTLAEDMDDVMSILQSNETNFKEELDQVRGKVEMGVRVGMDLPNVFEYFVNKYSELTTLRDRILTMQNAASQLDKIELGRVFERILNEERERHTNSVKKVLQTLCDEIIENPPRDEREVMHLACLITRENQKAFEDSIFEAAKLFNNDFTFDFNGPWAPHHFIRMNVEA